MPRHAISKLAVATLAILSSVASCGRKDSPVVRHAPSNVAAGGLATAFMYPVNPPMSASDVASRAASMASRFGLDAGALRDDGTGALTITNDADAFSYAQLRVMYRHTVGDDVLPYDLSEAGTLETLSNRAAQIAGVFVHDMGLTSAALEPTCFGADGSLWESRTFFGDGVPATDPCPELEVRVSARVPLAQGTDPTQLQNLPGLSVQFRRRLPIGITASGDTVYAPIYGLDARVDLGSTMQVIGLTWEHVDVDESQRVPITPEDPASVVSEYNDLVASGTYNPLAAALDPSQDNVRFAFNVAVPELNQAGHSDGVLHRHLPITTLRPGVAAITGDMDQTDDPATREETMTFGNVALWLPLDTPYVPKHGALDVPGNMYVGQPYTMSVDLPGAASADWYIVSSGIWWPLGSGPSVTSTSDLQLGWNRIVLQVGTPPAPGTPGQWLYPDGSTRSTKAVFYSYAFDVYGHSADEPPGQAPVKRDPPNPGNGWPGAIFISDVATENARNYEVTFYNGYGLNRREGSIMAKVRLTGWRYTGAQAGASRRNPITMTAAWGVRFWQYQLAIRNADGGTGTYNSDYCSFSRAENNNRQSVCRGHMNPTATIPNFVTYDPAQTVNPAPTDTGFTSTRQFHALPGDISVVLHAETYQNVSGGPNVPGAIWTALELAEVTSDISLQQFQRDEYNARKNAFGKHRPGVRVTSEWTYGTNRICLRDIAKVCASRYGAAEAGVNARLYVAHTPPAACTGIALDAYNIYTANANDARLDAQVDVANVDVRTFTQWVPFREVGDRDSYNAIVEGQYTRTGALPLIVDDRNGEPPIGRIISIGAFEQPVIPFNIPQAAQDFLWLNPFYTYLPATAPREWASVTRRNGTIGGDYVNVHFKEPYNPDFPSNIVVPGCANTFPMWKMFNVYDPQSRRLIGTRKAWFMDPTPACNHLHSVWPGEDPFETDSHQADQRWAIGLLASSSGAFGGGTSFPMKAIDDGGTLCRRTGNVQMTGRNHSSYSCDPPMLWMMTQSHFAPADTGVKMNETPIFLTQ